MKKLLVVMLVLALLVPSLSAMAVTVGFSQIGAESDWRVANTKSINEALEGAGYTVVFDDAQQQQPNQIRALRNFITQGVDYIVFTGVVTTGWDEVLQEVIDAEIPLILVDRFPETELGDDYYVTLINSDFTEEGRRAGQWLVEFMKLQGRDADDIKIVELQGTTGSQPAIERQVGFMDYMADFPNFEVIATQTGNFTSTEGQAVMETFLKSHPEIDVLYAHNDQMAIGAIEAIKAAGKVPGQDIIIVSIDAVKAIFDEIVAGNANCTVECSPLLGPQVAEIIATLEAGGTVEKHIRSIEYAYDTEGGIPYADGLVTMVAADEIDNRQY